MKKFLLFFLSLLAIGTAQAAPNFKANTKYRISCKKFNSSNSYGSVVIGSNHSKLVELYYDSGNSYSDDSWWYINKSGNGYVIVNAKSGQYLTFTTTKKLQNQVCHPDQRRVGKREPVDFRHQRGRLCRHCQRQRGQWFGLPL